MPQLALLLNATNDLTTVEGIARLDCELMVTNVLECELPEEGRTRRTHAILKLPGCHVSANHVHEP